ncbi:GGDEF domain-containing protein (plasmid) [Streptomyces sp. BH-SS-21]|uniref:GGDEF domain-containing protein n=1 Tax=Streptomyces liliiviolaceus TaxID=2823109 RepID=A0A940Y512_9ACTN|nr:GGDEF domain-containing protein [Streptomyces liliiviolaceus]MBQ0855736.1 GGDEF domain-containing protein [Streptomyces liliiviolaceus]
MPGPGALRQPTRTFLITAAVVPLALAVVADDVRVRRQLHTARRDPLTGLPGRDILTDRIDRLAHTRRELLHVLVADADGLKAVNDTLGHPAGDALIAAIGRRLSTWAAGRSGLAARLGGDEFGVTVLMPRATAVRDIVDLHTALAQPVTYEGQPLRDIEGQLVRPSVSIGIARAADLPDAAGASRILRGADMAMYKVKTGQEPLGYTASRQDAYAPAVHGRRPGRRGTALGARG